MKNNRRREKGGKRGILIVVSLCEGTGDSQHNSRKERKAEERVRRGTPFCEGA